LKASGAGGEVHTKELTYLFDYYYVIKRKRSRKVFLLLPRMEERPKKRARKDEDAANEDKTSSPPAMQVQAILKEHPWIETFHGFKPPNGGHHPKRYVC